MEEKKRKEKVWFQSNLWTARKRNDESREPGVRPGVGVLSTTTPTRPLTPPVERAGGS